MKYGPMPIEVNRYIKGSLYPYTLGAAFIGGHLEAEETERQALHPPSKRQTLR
jgi:hypothetical protein